MAENTGLAFFGENLWLPAQLTVRQAKNFENAPNPTGRPNSDVIRRLVGVESDMVKEYIQIDFPAHFNEQEASLYLKPARHFRSKQKAFNESWWVNPHTNSKLRTAVARLERYLATPFNGKGPTWDWIESERLPTASLLAVARDDDFCHGVLQSHFFQAWWHEQLGQLSPVEIVKSFPFPWPPATLLSALTRTQEELRLGVARAARSGDQGALDAAVATAYAGSETMTDKEIIIHLGKLNIQRAATGIS